MGSSSSRLGSRPSRGRVNRSKLSALICGGSSSHASLEMESDESRVDSTQCCDSHNNVTQNFQAEESPSLISNTGTRFTSSSAESGTSSDGISDVIEDDYVEDSSESIETNSQGRCLTDYEVVAPHQVSVDHSNGESSDPVSRNVLANKDVVNRMDDSVSKSISDIRPEPSTLSPQQLQDSFTDESHVDEEMAVRSSNHAAVAPVSDLPSPGDESIQEGLGFLLSNRERGRRDGSVLHVDVVSISSNIFSRGDDDASSSETRRNSGRLFWDAFSRRSSRRLIDSPTVVFSTDDTDGLGSHGRWLLDFSGGLFNDGAGNDSEFLGRRIRSWNEHRRHSRSEIWDRLRGGRDENGRRTAFCPSGLHPDGTCSCESFLMTEESGTRASISRIVMLAEALFEVLDEIHRQPVPLSLSMVSLPAPDSVVDSFPLKNHKKVDAAKGRDDVEQCYICLAEYEEGEKIRVLPCQHEYHMSCVDKWLKEIHGICPLCRGDVRQGVTECSVSNSATPSL